MNHDKYRDEWRIAEKMEMLYGTSYHLATIPSIPVVFVTDPDGKPLGALQGDAAKIATLASVIEGTIPAHSYSAEQMTALIVELREKVYNTCMGKMGTLLEVLMPERVDANTKSRRRLDESLRSLLESQVDHAMNAFTDVLRKRMPEITSEMQHAVRVNNLKLIAKETEEIAIGRLTDLGLPQKVQ